MDTREGKRLHIVMLPWLAHGHITPFLELSKRLAEKGHSISFVSTPRNIERLPQIPEHLSPLINLVKLPFPPDKREGLPPDAESMSDIYSNKLPLLLKAFEGLQEQIAEFLESSLPDWVMYDPFAFWVLKLFEESKILKQSVSKALFLNISASSMCFYFPSSSNNDHSIGRNNLEDFLFPPKWIPFPNNLAYRTHEVIRVAEQLDGYGGDDAVTLPQCFHTSVTGCDAIFMQGCLELEADYFKLLEELHGKPVLATGFLTPLSQNQGVEDEGWRLIKDWLDKRDKGSVIYIALGSEATPPQKMLTELALGLELSELSFLWALRKPKPDEDPLELPDGFEERTKDRGLLWRSWAPQLKILSHDSVGGFLSHCGWNSTLDGLQFGRPFIMLPLHGDQGLNARLLEEKEVGIEIPRDELDGSFTRHSVAESLRLVLVEEGGKIYREKAAQMRALVGDRNLHKEYIDKLEVFMCSQNRRDK